MTSSLSHVLGAVTSSIPMEVRRRSPPLTPRTPASFPTFVSLHLFRPRISMTCRGESMRGGSTVCLSNSLSLLCLCRFLLITPLCLCLTSTLPPFYLSLSLVSLLSFLLSSLFSVLSSLSLSKSLFVPFGRGRDAPLPTSIEEDGDVPNRAETPPQSSEGTD